MCEFQAEAPVANPADHALDRAVFAEVELEQSRILDRSGADHRTTARDVDELHLVFGARVSHARLLPNEAVPIALATIAARTLSFGLSAAARASWETRSILARIFINDPIWLRRRDHKRALVTEWFILSGEPVMPMEG